jgi:hypothetical protein
MVIRTFTAGTKDVPQPFLKSPSLRSTWLLPGFWNHDRRVLAAGLKKL